MRSTPRIVALGGGHGLAASLTALRDLTDDLTAIVTVADDGGSSGRLRQEFGVLPPGDLRMALAALCGDDFSEVGMTIAYLKRSLKAANDALGAASRLRQAGLIDDEDLGQVNELLFPIRERIVDMMGEFREELRRRRGES